jgi:hypothetical protein
MPGARRYGWAGWLKGIRTDMPPACSNGLGMGRYQWRLVLHGR